MDLIRFIEFACAVLVWFLVVFGLTALFIGMLYLIQSRYRD